MRTLLCLCLGVATIFSNLIASGQKSASEAQKDVHALEIINDAIQSMQNGVPLPNIQLASSEGTMLLTHENGEKKEVKSFQYLDKYANGSWSFTHEIKDSSHVEKISADAKGVTVTFDGNSHPSRGVHRETERAPFYFPSVILQSAVNDPSMVILNCGLETIGGEKLEHVRLIPTIQHLQDIDGTQDWFFNPTSHIPSEINYHIIFGHDSDKKHYRRIILTDIKMFHGVAVATSIAIYRDNVPMEVIGINTVSFSNAQLEQASGAK